MFLFTNPHLKISDLSDSLTLLFSPQRSHSKKKKMIYRTFQVKKKKKKEKAAQLFRFCTRSCHSFTVQAARVHTMFDNRKTFTRPSAISSRFFSFLFYFFFIYDTRRVPKRDTTTSLLILIFRSTPCAKNATGNYISALSRNGALPSTFHLRRCISARAAASLLRVQRAAMQRFVSRRRVFTRSRVLEQFGPAQNSARQ